MNVDNESPILIRPSGPRGRAAGAAANEQQVINGFAPTYLRLCRGQAKPLCSRLEPRAGDWILGKDGQMSLCPDPPRELSKDEVVVPRLDRVVELLREVAPTFVIDCYPQDYACAAFDEESRSLANVVSKSPEEAALRALLFVRSEKAANAMS